MERHPGDSPAAQARYFEAVHQELAPLARKLETELQACKDDRAAAIDDLRGQCRRLRSRAAKADRRALWVLENAAHAVEIVRRWDPTQGTLLAYVEHRVCQELGEMP